MNVRLTPQLEAMIHRKVESGLYASASEVVREALRLMDQADRWAAFKAEIALGDADPDRGAASDWHPGSMTDVIAEADARLGSDAAGDAAA